MRKLRIVHGKRELFLVDLVSAGSNFSTGRHLLKRAGLGGIDPDK
jgi:hypothetical protein